MTSHGNPAGVPSISVHAGARGLRPGPGNAVQHGRRARQVQRAAHRRAARRRPEHRGQVRQHRDVAHARGAQRDRRRHRHQHDSPVKDRRLPCFLQRRAQPRGKPRLVSGLAQQDRAGVADLARPITGDLQGMVPRHMLHGEERSRSRSYTGVVTAQSPRTRALFAVEPVISPAPRTRAARTHQVRHYNTRHQARSRKTPAHNHAAIGRGLIRHSR